jgi:hypothetical protein
VAMRRQAWVCSQVRQFSGGEDAHACVPSSI